MAHPLKPGDFDNIQTALSSIAESEKICVRARNSGIDVTEREEKLTAAKTRLNGIKNGFFPNGRES